MFRMRFFGHFYKADYSGGHRKFWRILDFGPGHAVFGVVLEHFPGSFWRGNRAGLEGESGSVWSSVWRGNRGRFGGGIGVGNTLRKHPQNSSETPSKSTLVLTRKRAQKTPSEQLQKHPQKAPRTAPKVPSESTLFTPSRSGGIDPQVGGSSGGISKKWIARNHKKVRS
jgi:hypothetical protein